MTAEDDELLRAVHRRGERQRRWQQEGEPSFGRQLAQIGVLGWIIVVPTLLFTFFGRWLDRRFGTGIFLTAPLLFIGLAIGCYAGWRWMHSQ